MTSPATLLAERSGTPSTQAASANRIDWVDYAKGICMIGVVTLYAANRLHHSGGAGWLQVWADFARPFRMPDFFLLSGLFLGRVIDRPWKNYLDKKVAHFLYFFLLWSVIFYATRSVIASVRPSLADEGAGSLLYKLVEPYAMLWFIQLLPVFFVLTRLLRKVPVWVILPIAALLQLFAPSDAYPTLVKQFCERFVYFYLGYRFAAQFFALAAWAQAMPLRATFALVGWMAINAILVFQRVAQQRGIALGLGVLGAMGVITAGALLMKVRGTAWLRYIGHHSLIVYLAFYPPMLAFFALSNRLGGFLDRGTLGFLVSILSALSAFTLYWITRNTPFSFLFFRPRWFGFSPKRLPASDTALQGLRPDEA